MSLPQQGPAVDPQQMAIFDQMRQEISPKEFGDELLNSAMQADPEAVKAFKDELMALEVPIDTLMLLNEMVDVILANPQDYPSLRREYLRRGVTEDVLPPTFDPAFFGALNMALDQMPVQQPQAPAQMAGGGIAQLAQYGRNGDTMLAHINPQEAAMLKRMGGAGTINPMTGLPEYGNIFSSIGKAVKKFASSTVGKIITTVALGFFLGPAAAGMLGVTSSAGVAAVSGFIGSAGSTLLAGGKLKDALKAGAIGGLTAGAGAGIMGGADAFAAGSYTGPTTVGGQFDRLTEGAKTLVSPAQAAPSALPTIEQIAAGNPSLAQPAGFDYVSGAPLSVDAAQVQVGAPLSPRVVPPPAATEGLSFQESMTRGPLSEMAARPVQGPTDLYSEAITPPGGNAYARTPPVGMGQGQDLYKQALSPSGNMPPPPPPGTEPGFMDKAKGLYDKYMPEALGGSRGAVPPEVYQKAREAYTQEMAASGDRYLARMAMDEVIKKGTPGILSTYGPLAAVGLGATALAGGFKTKPVEMPLGKPETGFDRLKQYPERYNLSFGGISGTRSYYNPYTAGLLSPPRAADGGIMSLEVGGRIHPRKTGHITGPGTSTSDSIPALLSDGEFVFTAKAVRAMGQGSRRKGAKRLYSMMKMLEKRQG